MAPLNGDYNFYVNCDGAASIKINDKMILDHYMTDPEKSDFPWGAQSKSNKITMNAGMMYEFEIKYWRA